MNPYLCGCSGAFCCRAPSWAGEMILSGVGVLNAIEHCSVAGWGWKCSLCAGFVSLGMCVLAAPVPVCCGCPRAEGPQCWCLRQPGAVLGCNSEQGNIKLLQSQLGQNLCAWGLEFVCFLLLPTAQQQGEVLVRVWWQLSVSGGHGGASRAWKGHVGGTGDEKLCDSSAKASSLSTAQDAANPRLRSGRRVWRRRTRSSCLLSAPKQSCKCQMELGEVFGRGESGAALLAWVMHGTPPAG